MSNERTALVTGVSSGFGHAIAVELGKNGYTVGLVARRRDRLVELAATIPGAYVLAGDLRDPSFSARVVDDFVDRVGRLDLLVNNAGAPTPANRDVATDEEFDAAIALNVRAIFRLSHAAMPHLARTRGSIVNISSAGVARNVPIDLVYLTSKGAVEIMSRGMAKKWGTSGVRVNVVAPGVVPTEIFDHAGIARDEVRAVAHKMQPLERAGTPDDIARAVSYLASDAAAFITGATLHVDGGMALGG